MWITRNEGQGHERAHFNRTEDQCFLSIEDSYLVWVLAVLPQWEQTARSMPVVAHRDAHDKGYFNTETSLAGHRPALFLADKAHLNHMRPGSCISRALIFKRIFEASWRYLSQRQNQKIQSNTGKVFNGKRMRHVHFSADTLQIDSGHYLPMHVPSWRKFSIKIETIGYLLLLFWVYLFSKIISEETYS